MGAEALRAIFPFDGRYYNDFDALLEHERPDIVDICLPNELHFAYEKKALEQGSHVLCEKPLFGEEHAESEELARKARELVRIAHARGLHLGMCSQYAAALPHYERVERVHADVYWLSRPSLFMSRWKRLFVVAIAVRKKYGLIWAHIR